MKHLLVLAACVLMALGCGLGGAVTPPPETLLPVAPSALTSTPAASSTPKPSPAGGTILGGFIGTPIGSPEYFPPPPESQPIQFQSGATSAEVTGQLAAHSSNVWIVRVEAGQTLSAKITSSVGQTTMIISGADGLVLQVDQERATRFSGVLPTTQDYYISAIADTEPSSYSLSVTVK